MKRLITAAEGAYMFTVWLLLVVLLLAILPIHVVSMLLTRGCDAVTIWAAEIQSIAVAKMKGPQ